MDTYEFPMSFEAEHPGDETWQSYTTTLVQGAASDTHPAGCDDFAVLRSQDDDHNALVSENLPEGSQNIRSV